MGNSILRSWGLAAWALVVLQVACDGAENQPLFFQDVLTKKGDDYVKARDAVVARGEEVRPFLKEVTQTSRDWRERVAARILLGWLDHADLYAELWDWAPPRSDWRNPFPFYYKQAYARFYNEGEKVIPLMLELVWKKDQLQFGALPALLAKSKVELALPVLVRQEQGYPNEMTGFGAAATPYILEVLPRRSTTDAVGLCRRSVIQADLRRCRNCVVVS
jgi:hypothetical protein